MSEDAAAKARKGPKLWFIVKNSAFVVILLLFILVAVLMLDAYKYVTFRHAKFARTRLLSSLQYMDPTFIESHTGMKVLTVEEYEKLEGEAGEVRAKIREANVELQNKANEKLLATVEEQKIRKGMEDIKKILEEAKTEDETSKGNSVPEEKAQAIKQVVKGETAEVKEETVDKAVGLDDWCPDCNWNDTGVQCLARLNFVKGRYQTEEDEGKISLMKQGCSKSGQKKDGRKFLWR